MPVALPPARRVITIGSGGWIVFCYCCPWEWIRRLCRTRAGTPAGPQARSTMG